MTTDVLLVSAPVMSVLRPSAALGLLQSALTAIGVRTESLYLNLMFAEMIGIDLNERLGETLPSHLLAGEWLFEQPAPAVNAKNRAVFEGQLNTALEQHKFDDLEAIKSKTAPAFILQAAQAILRRKPRILGFTTMFQQTMASLEIAASVKRAAPEIIICFGGANCHGPMGAVLIQHYPQIDYVFTGEADALFPDFVKALLAGRSPRRTQGWLGRMSGTHPLSQPVRELDDLPIPDYSDYFSQLARMSEAHRIRSSVPFESSRGCWWGQKNHCTFCGLNATSMVFREKSGNRVLRELGVLARAYGIKRFSACDNILSMGHVDRVIAELDGNVQQYRFFYEIKSNLDEAKLRILGKAGVVWIQPGIESLSDPVLKLMRKGVDRMLNLRLLRNCREFGMCAIWSMLYGFPGEAAADFDDVARIVPMLEHLQPPVGCGRIRLDRFSPNFEQAEAIGFTDVQPVSSYGAIFNLPADALFGLAYFFDGYAPRAASESDLIPLKQAIAAWRSAWLPGTTPPRLVALPCEGRCLIEDTRRCAIERFFVASELETAIIGHCRSARAIAKFDILTDRWSPSEIEAALGNLLYRNYLLTDQDRVISLIVTSGNELFSDEDRADLPFGYVASSSVQI
ncbi:MULTISPECIES: RiPP maturation radical SAM C-methyltransferase [Pseudomonas]|uniref:RiPP maturation radical SAM C-methyltransferase n=1 Tax=Pseudomonas wuhanensis TaxID=2954098 RepID=A0ABY9GUL9_9PSED|nr:MULTISPECIES: RiPP maturation radical SAM C-methyltransferase [unclassified Pseudomonas]WLI13456.1 RiPP maturation radical SAM C-methyltransferase [Pseudomonas sp. FP603]WLI19343.1 RiPP maturation radical SAM C-methyltransferase [Pseudomonas sp. FP607]